MSKKLVKVPLPLWLKKGMPVWVEIRDDQDIEILEYKEGVIKEFNMDTKDLKVLTTKDNQVVDVLGDHIQERAEEHNIVSDLSDIPILNDAEILKHMEIRYMNDMIHCFCGPTMIVVNPYKCIENEVSETLKSSILNNLINKELFKAPPHVWTISAIAWDNVFSQGVNQAICIQGESGAGKTESTKKCLEFITMNKNPKASHVSTKESVENRIMQCNPILECVGNAKTARNDNSSRFGKYTVLYIDKETKQVKGSGIQPYLLEKSRVTHISNVERNYHIFYVMCQFLNVQWKQELCLSNSSGEVDMTKFKLLNKSPIYATPTVKDKEFYDDMMNSFSDLNFTEDQQKSVWALLSAVLHIGNLEVDSSCFVDGKQPCKIKNNDMWKELVKITGFKGDQVEKALTNKQFLIGGQETISPLTPDKVQMFIEVISRELYQRLFLWLVYKLNDQLLPHEKDPSNYATIGVLDIFGFEIFENNSLEQLFINFANEKLQGLFVEYIFKNECKIFEQEGLGDFIKLITYKDNIDLIMALDNDKLPPGVFNLLDQNCMLNKTDLQYADEMKKLHAKTERLKFPNFSGKGEFTVIHTARDVLYKTNGFIEKNKDEVSQYLDNAIQTCNEKMLEIVKINEILAAKESGQATGKKNPKEKFLGYKFRQSMNSLVSDLSACFCQFIRCLKPNEKKARNTWDGGLALRQVRYMGLLDSLKIRKNSFPFRYLYDKFFKTFQELDLSPVGCMKFETLVENGTNFKVASQNLIKNANFDFTEKDILYGKTRIFLNEKAKIEVDRRLLIIQKKKQEALDVISSIYKNKKLREKINGFISSQQKGISLAVNILSNLIVQVAAMRHKNQIATIKRVQAIVRYQAMKRRIKHVKKQANIISNYYRIYLVSNVFTYIKNYQSNLQLVQCMLEKKIRLMNYNNVIETVQYIVKLSFDRMRAQEVENGAQIFQNAFRAYLQRKKEQKVIKEYKKKIENFQFDESVTKIQKMIRGFIARRQYQKKKQAAQRIQGFIRSKWLHEYFLEMVNAARVIQRFYRIYLLKKRKKEELLMNFVVPKDEEKNQRKSTYSQLFDESYNTDPISTIPSNNQIDRYGGYKFATFLVDFSQSYLDNENQQQQWIDNFKFLQDQMYDKQQRIAHIEIGGDFTLIITDNRDVYAFGGNDQYQSLSIPSDEFNITLTQLQQFWQYPMKMVSSGNQHSMLVDEADNIYIWGSNQDNQLGVDNSNINKGIVKLDYIQEPVKTAIAKENKNFILTESGNVIAFPWFNGEKHKEQSFDMYNTQNLKQDYIPRQINSEQIKIDKIAAGIDFIIAINKIGQLFSAGSNIFGELGHGDRKERFELTQVQYLAKKAERVIEISCGCKHSVCMCFSSRVYLWGCNSNYQLGFENRQPVLTPQEFKSQIPSKSKIRSVEAAAESVYFLCEDRRIYYTGKSGQTLQEPKPGLQQLNYMTKLFQTRMLDRFIPIKLSGTFGRKMSGLVLVCVDLKNNNISNKQLSMNLQQFKQIQNAWKEKPTYIYPRQKQVLDKLINIKYMVKERQVTYKDYGLQYKTQQIDFKGTQKLNKSNQSAFSTQKMNHNNQPVKSPQKQIILEQQVIDTTQEQQQNSKPQRKSELQDYQMKNDKKNSKYQQIQSPQIQQQEEIQQPLPQAQIKEDQEEVDLLKEQPKKNSIASKKQSSISNKKSITQKLSLVQPKQSVVQQKQSIMAKKQSVAPPKKSISKDKRSISKDSQTDSYDYQEEPLQKLSVVQPKQSLVQQKQSIVQPKQSLAQQKQSIAQPKQSIAQQKQSIVQPKQSIVQEKQSIVQPKQSIVQEQETIEQPKQSIVQEKISIVQPKQSVVQQKQSIVQQRESQMGQKQSIIQQKQSIIQQRESSAGQKQSIIQQKQSIMSQRQSSAGQKQSIIQKQSIVQPNYETAPQKQSVISAKQSVIQQKQSIVKTQELYGDQQQEVEQQQVEQRESMKQAIAQ